MAHMSANILSAYRTGAIPGVGARYYSREDSRTVGIVGPGVMSRTAFDSFMTVRPGINRVQIKGRGKKSMQSFIDYVKGKYPTVSEIVVADDIEGAAKDADILFLGTSSPTGDINEYPYVKEEWIKPGAFICCPAAARFDDDFILNRARNVADYVPLYEAWAEEMPYPAYHTIPIPAVHCMDLMADGRLSKDQLEDLSDVLTGKLPARKNEDEIIVYSVGGLPVEDVAWGTIVYRNALEKGIGTTLNLWDEPYLA